MSEFELIKIAKQSSDKNILSDLSDHYSSTVRRVVAKNRFTPKNILKKLSYDPVMNVSFMAVNNLNNTEVSREFNEHHPCVVCNTDELVMNCNNCSSLISFNNRGY